MKYTEFEMILLNVYDHFSAHSLLAKLGRGIRDENLCYFDGLIIDSLHIH